MNTVYLLHFEKKFKHAQHYIGFTDNLQARMERHKAGNGAKLISAITRAGIGFVLAFQWDGKDRAFERHLKKRKQASAFCPICKGEKINAD